MIRKSKLLMYIYIYSECLNLLLLLLPSHITTPRELRIVVLSAVFLSSHALFRSITKKSSQIYINIFTRMFICLTFFCRFNLFVYINTGELKCTVIVEIHYSAVYSPLI